MATVYNTIFKLKRGNISRWEELNPILEQGEPGFAYDVNLLKIGNGVTPWKELPYVNEAEILDILSKITAIQELVGDIPVKEQINQVITEGNFLNKEDAEEIYLNKKSAEKLYNSKRYEVSNLPKGALVDYSDAEIRVFCPQDAEWVKQNVGPTGNANMYYMSFKAYAPEGAVSFKEGDRGVIIDKMHTFDEDFSGIDEYGRKYSICWLALANYNPDTNIWNYFGKNSSFKKYIGWNYIVEWYNQDGVIIDSDIIKINLSNENCHYNNEPYYMASINVNRLTQDENDTLVLYGGSATDNI